MYTHRIRKTISQFLLPLLACFSLTSAHAVVVNIEGNSVYWASHPGDTILLSAGTYQITPIGIANGGTYNAWNAWGSGATGCDTAGVCSRGYLNSYSFYQVNAGWGTLVNMGGLVVDGSAIAYGSEMLALANAQSSIITLQHADYLRFFVYDGESWYSDNIGGMSLKVESVPVPAAVWLLGSGLFGMIGVARPKAA